LGTESEVAPEALRSRLTLAFRARTRPHLPRSRTSVDFTDPQVNLLNADLLGLPPIAVFYGEDELLVSEAVEFGLRAQRAGNDVIVRSVEAGQHSFIMGAGASARGRPGDHRDGRLAALEAGTPASQHLTWA